MIARIDENICIGCGLCANIAPNIFKMEGVRAIVIVTVVQPELEEVVADAYNNCPVEAIALS